MARHRNEPLHDRDLRVLFVLAWWLHLAAAGLCVAAPTPPPGWRLELIAQTPAVRHPSVVCSAPDGRVFVAEDPMDISAPAHATQGRVLCFYPDGRRTVFAEKLHAVFGMQYLEGKLFVLHNPKFTVFTDAEGVGRNPLTLIEQTHPNPWALEWNDHVPANFQLAMDGYFYIAVGDKGIYGAVGRDGQRVDLRGGGILRMRPDGTGLEVYGTGVRNILDVALNVEDELFTYDNTDEHDWMGRLTHMVDGGFYGYPHDFIPRRPYTLWMMHDFGGGAATGTLAYNEDALPPEYRGNLFLADFGKRQVTRVVLERDGATFRVKRHEEMFKNLPDDFRPVGITVSADGAGLYICDWQHRDTKENVEAGRLWKLAWTGTNHAVARPAWSVPAAMGQTFQATDQQLITGLAHSSRAVRLTAQRRLSDRRAVRPLAVLLQTTNASPLARSHAVWALDAIDGGSAVRSELAVAMKDADPMVRRAAIRQSGQRQVRTNLDLFRAALQDDDVTIRFQAATALGRITDSNSVPALLSALEEKDLFTRYAVFKALNRIGRAEAGTWKAIARGLESESERIREGAAFAMRETYDLAIIDVLAGLVSRRRGPEFGSAVELDARLRSLHLLALLHHTVPEWKGEWWAYHPALAPAPKKNVAWAGTTTILALLRESVDDQEPRLRLAAIEGIRSAADTNASAHLRARFDRETTPEVRRALIGVLGEFKDMAFSDVLARVLRDSTNEADTSRAAIRAAARLGGGLVTSALLDLLDSPALNPEVRAEVAQALGELNERKAITRLQPLMTDASQPLRVAAQAAMARVGGDIALPSLRPLLTNVSPVIRAEGVRAVGSLRDRKAVPDLLAAWRDAATRVEALDALTRVSDARALEAYLEALSSANPALRDQTRKVLVPIRDAVLPRVEQRAETLPAGVIAELRRVYKGHSAARKGRLFTVTARLPEPQDYERHALQHRGDAVRGQRLFFDESGVACLKCHAVAGHGGSVGPDLTLIGAQFPRGALIEHVLQPSKAVREGYQQMTLELRNGDEFSGILKSETPESVTFLDANNRLMTLAKKDIASRTAGGLSLMPEGLHAGLTLDQFADLIAYMESRKIDPTVPVVRAPLPEAFEELFDGRTLEGWRELPPGTKRVDEQALQLARPPEHWRATNGILEHDGMTGDLWSERQFADFELHLEWRWPDAPKWEQFPLINSAGVEGDEQGHAATLRVLDAGDSGVLLRGLYKAQANLFCYPVGSGEVWEYRTDASMTPEQRRAVTPRRAADRPIGDWNEMVIRLRGGRLSVVLNGVEVIREAQLPGIPARGPIGLQHEHGRIQFRNLRIRELR